MPGRRLVSDPGVFLSSLRGNVTIAASLRVERAFIYNESV